MSTTALKAAATGNQPGTGVSKPATFPAMIDTLKKQVALALPKHMNPDRMARIALTEFRKNKDLAECKPESIFASIIIASQLGLEPGINGQGYLIPYAGTCTFVPGWKGLVDLAQRSGRSSVWTGAVFEGDDFAYEKGTKPFITHKECGESDPAKLTHVYAVGWVRGAEHPVLEVWPMSKVYKHRDKYNKVGRSHYSFKHPEMYARKVALLQVLKYMPQSIELSMAADLDGNAEIGKGGISLEDAIDGVVVPADSAGQEGSQSGPVQESESIELMRACKTEDELTDVWLRIRNSYGDATMPVAIEAARNTYRDILKEKAGAK